VLYREIHHRVKNNLAVVQSYVDLSRDAIEDVQASARESAAGGKACGSSSASSAADRVLASAQSMITTVASIHDLLHHDPSVEEARLDTFVEALARSVANTFRRPDVELVTDLEPISVEVERLFACGLLVNELVTNAMKHAFPHSGGTVRVALRTESRDGGPVSLSDAPPVVVLEVSDDGPGLPEDGLARRGFGTDLIRLQVDKLNGTLHRTHDDGLTVRVRFPSGQGRDIKVGAAKGRSM
jgi:two-component sensor histidine kinase